MLASPRLNRARSESASEVSGSGGPAHVAQGYGAKEAHLLRCAACVVQKARGSFCCERFRLQSRLEIHSFFLLVSLRGGRS